MSTADAPPSTGTLGNTPITPPSTSGGSTPELRHAGDLIDRVAAADQEVTDEERVDALEWLLADEGDPEYDSGLTKPLELNVGTDTDPRWIEWTVQAVPEAEIKSIRRMTSGANRQQRRSGQENPLDQADEFNLRVATIGTLKPDLMALAQKRGIADPAKALQMRFRRKWGLISLIAGEVVALSGVDEEAVRDGKEIRAALD